MEDINTRLGKTKDYAIQCLKDEAEALMELIPSSKAMRAKNMRAPYV